MRKTPPGKGSVRLSLCRLLFSPPVFCCVIAVLWQPALALGQTTDSLTGKIAGFPSHLLQKVRSKTADLESRLTRQTDKYLQKMARREQRLKDKLYRIDSTGAKSLFADPKQQYAALAARLRSDTGSAQTNLRGAYSPYLDSLRCSVAFLQQHPQLSGLTAVSGNPEFQSTLSQVQSLQAKMQDADQIRQYVADRKQQIRNYLLQHAQLPGLSSEYRKLNEDLYYYTQQVQSYKDMLNDPDKLQKNALALLNRLPAFQQFMKNNSQLAALFGTPPGYGTPQSIAGLPTRDQVQDMIRTQLGAGLNTDAATGTGFPDAKSALDGLKDKLVKYGQGGGDVDIPDFKPNSQKTRSFLRRLEYGINFQTQTGTYFFPTTTDLGGSVGYKLSDKNTIGIGASYKIGWGSDIRHISITGQGASLRSFLDVKVKQSLSVTGGFEYNYQLPFSGILPPSLKGPGLNAWQKSGLIGLSKTVSVRSKLFKKTQVQFLWDFLSYEQVPRTQPIKFRVAYNF